MILKTTDASKYLGVSINTLKTLANGLRLRSFKTSGGHRRFRQEDLDFFIGKVTETPEKITVIYARCSTAKQKENLERQKDRLMRHAEAKGYKYIVIDEIASGINEKRKGLHKLLNMAFQGKIERVLIEYKDRIARFGYECLDHGTLFIHYGKLSGWLRIKGFQEVKTEDFIGEKRSLVGLLNDKFFEVNNLVTV